MVGGRGGQNIVDISYWEVFPCVKLSVHKMSCYSII